MIVNYSLFSGQIVSLVNWPVSFFFSSLRPMSTLLVMSCVLICACLMKFHDNFN